MRSLMTLVLVGAATIARADATPPATVEAPAASCSFADGPLDRALRSLDEHEVRHLQSIARQGGEPLSVLGATAQHLLFSNWYSEPAGTRVFARDTLAVVASWSLSTNGLVADKRGRWLGVLRFAAPVESGHQGLAFLEPESGRERWRRPHLVLASNDAAVGLAVADLLVVATYGRATSGAMLYGLSLGDGAVRWIADVDQPRFGHSRSMNDVALERRGATVILRGFEAGGCYVQVFDLATGKRLSSSLRR